VKRSIGAAFSFMHYDAARLADVASMRHFRASCKFSLATGFAIAAPHVAPSDLAEVTAKHAADKKSRY
jgi:hypothetical protein